MPAFSRGPRRRRTDRASASDLFLAIPRLDPEWELAALHALMKPPRRRQVVRHRTPVQPWSDRQSKLATDVLHQAAQLLGIALDVSSPPQGDLLLIAQSASGALTPDILNALALVVSHALPGISIRAGRILARDGQFLRRRRGVELILGPARDVHLRREIRAVLAPLLQTKCA